MIRTVADMCDELLKYPLDTIMKLAVRCIIGGDECGNDHEDFQMEIIEMRLQDGIESYSIFDEKQQVLVIKEME